MSADLTTGAIGDARPTQAPPAEAPARVLAARALAAQDEVLHGLTFTENGGPPTLHLTDAEWLTDAGLAEKMMPPSVKSGCESLESGGSNE